MPAKKSQPAVTQNVTGDNNIVIAGNENTVNQTIIQKIFNIFKSDAETVDQRNRRIMLGHVENFWVKGILEKSLHSAALLELGIKEDPDALNYPWAIKREANKEILPAGMSMLEIYQEIGMGRSLLILGAPGSGKTTMLLELTRQLIEHAREDVTEPIPIVFNLSSWTEKLTLADWLARELNTIYYVPKKVAPTWVTGNKMLLLLDGLDEVRQEDRDKCVDAINQFRKENGLTSMAVCSRIQDYSDLKTRLSFEGAIEIQTLTSKQVNEYFKRFGKELAGIEQVLDQDAVLNEMAETPLFLSILALAYRGIQSKDILLSQEIDVQRRHVFDIYIDKMFERPHLNKPQFTRHDVLHWLSWLARQMMEYRRTIFYLEGMQLDWLTGQAQQRLHALTTILTVGLTCGLLFGLAGGLIGGLISGLIVGLFFGLFFGVAFRPGFYGKPKIWTVEILRWSWRDAAVGLVAILSSGLIRLILEMFVGMSGELREWLIFGLFFGLVFGLGTLVFGVHIVYEIEAKTAPNQGMWRSAHNAALVGVISALAFMLAGGILIGLDSEVVVRLTFGLGGGLLFGLFGALLSGLFGALQFGGSACIQHLILRQILYRNDSIPLNYVYFLNYCCDLIFLRRVGGGYIFVHRLLMEHFADMHPADEK